MALINCTHVLAVMTPRTKGSMWVPYEYGRIVDFPTMRGIMNIPTNSERAGCWLHPNIGYVPEYLNFGKKNRSEPEIEHWFQSEKHNFNGPCNPDWPDNFKKPKNSLDQIFQMEV